MQLIYLVTSDEEAGHFETEVWKDANGDAVVVVDTPHEYSESDLDDIRAIAAQMQTVVQFATSLQSVAMIFIQNGRGDYLCPVIDWRESGLILLDVEVWGAESVWDYLV